MKENIFGEKKWVGGQLILTKGAFGMKENIFDEKKWVSSLFSCVHYIREKSYPKRVCV